MKLLHIILILILAFSLVSLVTTFIYYKLNFSTLVEKRSIFARVEISEPNLLGFDVNTTLLNFGHVPLNGYGVKTVTITNTRHYALRGITIEEGNISPYLGFSHYTFSLQPGETMNLTVSVIPGDGPIGIYDGYVRIFFYRKR